MDARRGGIRVLFERWRRRSLTCAGRPRFLHAVILLVCGCILMHAFALGPFQVPTGSMAPALVGYHYACECPHCGVMVVVGRPRSERDYARAVCPNCGDQELHVGHAAETAGDQ